MDWYINRKVRADVKLRAVKIGEKLEGFGFFNIDQRTGGSVPIKVRNVFVPFTINGKSVDFKAEDYFFYGTREEIRYNFLRRTISREDEGHNYNYDKFRAEADDLFRKNRNSDRPNLRIELLYLADFLAGFTAHKVHLTRDKCPRLRDSQRDMLLHSISLARKQISEEDLTRIDIPSILIDHYPPMISKVGHDLGKFPRQLAYDAFIHSHYYTDKITSLRQKTDISVLPDAKFVSVPMGGKVRGK